MNYIKYVIINIVATLLRVVPFPCKTGLVELGHPHKDSPVFLTCNFRLTVERVKRSLKGIDCYLLIANSKGYNVWCGAAGGHFSNHGVISVLNTSRIGKLVDHRRVVLPQLAATGIETKVIREKTGWQVIWGPVYARDIPAFVKNRFHKRPEMREVTFPLSQRLETATMWAFPFSLVVAIIMAFAWRGMLLPLIIFFWIFSLVLFASFPLYARWVNPKKEGVGFSRYTVIFDFSHIALLFWGIFVLSLLFYAFIAGQLTLAFLSHWLFLSFAIILIFSLDLMGSTPLYKSGLHEDRFLKVSIDRQKCRGTGVCVEVCPRNCYRLDSGDHVVTMPRADRCVQCGACIVQCPFDALYFAGRNGEIVHPEVIRKFKLNLLGKRSG